MRRCCFYVIKGNFVRVGLVVVMVWILLYGVGVGGVWLVEGRCCVWVRVVVGSGSWIMECFYVVWVLYSCWDKSVYIYFSVGIVGEFVECMVDGFVINCVFWVNYLLEEIF